MRIHTAKVNVTTLTPPLCQRLFNLIVDFYEYLFLISIYVSILFIYLYIIFIIFFLKLFIRLRFIDFCEYCFFFTFSIVYVGRTSSTTKWCNWMILVWSCCIYSGRRECLRKREEAWNGVRKRTIICICSTYTYFIDPHRSPWRCTLHCLLNRWYHRWHYRSSLGYISDCMRTAFVSCAHFIFSYRCSLCCGFPSICHLHDSHPNLHFLIVVVQHSLMLF